MYSNRPSMLAFYMCKNDLVRHLVIYPLRSYERDRRYKEIGDSQCRVMLRPC